MEPLSDRAEPRDVPAPRQAHPAALSRPRNRRQLILDAAGRAFNDRGYYGTSLEEIAATVGTSAPALYRHFPNKYALFAECANFMADRLVEALEALPPGATLKQLFTAVARVTIAHRASGGVYRWEARYLNEEDRRLLRAKFAHVVDQVSEAVVSEYGAAQAHLRAAAALGAVGSITMHHTPIAARRAEHLLVAAAIRVAAAETRNSAGTASGVQLLAQSVPRTRRAQILAAAIPLFDRDGFGNVSLGRIADAVGIAPSAIYRHYPGKVDILAAACLQAAALLAHAVERALADTRDSPEGGVIALAATYVAYSFEHTSLTNVAAAELAGLPPDLRRPLVAAQGEHIAIWEQQLRKARPGLDARQAKILVHAGFGVVVEAGRSLHWQDSADNRDRVAALLIRALGL